MLKSISFLGVCAFLWCSTLYSQNKVHDNSLSEVTLVVLGTVQDGGSPHIGCTRSCCASELSPGDTPRNVVALGLWDKEFQKTFLMEAGPDIISQWELLAHASEIPISEPSGIFVTHAHIGHYAGLMYLGKESLNAKEIPVFAMPKMTDFLKNNGPWSQLISMQNVILKNLNPDFPVAITENLEVQPFLVPHRDEFSETVGYTISGPTKRVLFIPDIDKWDRWDQSIVSKIKEVDLAFLDATFFDAAEIGYRNISEIPHPFVVESLSLFESLPQEERQKVFFIHMNHTNPLLNPNSAESRYVIDKGYGIAREGMRFKL